MMYALYYSELRDGSTRWRHSFEAQREAEYIVLQSVIGDPNDCAASLAFWLGVDAENMR